MKKNNDENMYKTISSYILGDKGIPHCIIELSVKELRDLNSNRIHVSGIRSENNKIYYSTIGEYGKNINHSNVTRLIDEVNVNLHRINITKSKKRIFCITADSDEILNLRPETLVIKSTSRYNCPQGKEGINDTGVVVLFFGVVPPPTKIKYKMEMNKSFAETIAKTKNNITKKGAANHHNSTGKYYSFGNKGAYKIVNNSSVGQYSNKNITARKYKELLKDAAKDAEQLCACHLLDSVLSTQKHIRNMSKLIQPVLSTAYKIQDEIGSVNLKEVESTAGGMWQSSICINAKTTVFHTESDCTYTLCKIPNQTLAHDKNIDYQRMFFIQLNENETIAIPLVLNLTFVFTGMFITHRQHCHDYSNHDGSVFINLISYGNKRIFDHIKKSFERVQSSSNTKLN